MSYTVKAWEVLTRNYSCKICLRFNIHYAYLKRITSYRNFSPQFLFLFPQSFNILNCLIQYCLFNKFQCDKFKWYNLSRRVFKCKLPVKVPFFRPEFTSIFELNDTKNEKSQKLIFLTFFNEEDGKWRRVFKYKLPVKVPFFRPEFPSGRREYQDSFRPSFRPEDENTRIINRIWQQTQIVLLHLHGK